MRVKIIKQYLKKNDRNTDDEQKTLNNSKRTKGSKKKKM